MALKARPAVPQGGGDDGRIKPLDIMLGVMREMHSIEREKHAAWLTVRRITAPDTPEAQAAEAGWFLAAQAVMGYAKDCAPYVHPKLANAEIKSTSKIVYEVSGGLPDLEGDPRPPPPAAPAGA